MNKTRTLYIGNLPRNTSRADLARIVGHHGRVISVRLVTDRRYGHCRGFGFVELPAQDAIKAMAILNGSLFWGRELTVTEALPRPDRAAVQGGDQSWTVLSR